MPCLLTLQAGKAYVWDPEGEAARMSRPANRNVHQTRVSFRCRVAEEPVSDRRRSNRQLRRYRILRK